MIEKLAYYQNRKDQKPNKQLAQEIFERRNTVLILALRKLVESNQFPKRVKMDAIMTIAYLSDLDASLVLNLSSFLVNNLIHKEERILWASMIAIYHVIEKFPKKLYKHLSHIVHGMSRGSVVAKDYGFKILCEYLCHRSIPEEFNLSTY